MNTITHAGQSHDFTTRDELFAIARKVTGTDITHICRDGLRVYGADTRPVLCEIGTSKEPVLFLGASTRAAEKHGQIPMLCSSCEARQS